jgi:hypothetical protein
MASKSLYPPCIVKEGAWSDFRNDVRKVNPELYHIIEQISPDKKYTLFEITYLYGENITDLGTICLADKNGHSVRLDDPSIPDKYREQLDYCPTPLTLQLTNAAEVFLDTGERIIPLNIFTPGDLYGLFEAIMPLTGCSISPCWSVTAGARSVFLGAKVTDAIGHKRLRTEYGISSEPPKKLKDQWHQIKTIVNRSDRKTPWTCKILVFTKNWMEKKEKSLGWLLFHNYLLKKSWIQSRFFRSKSELSIMWETFASTVRDRNLKPGPYILDTVMHAIFLANGAVPGFRPADMSELLLPSLSVEYAYEHIYILKEYAAVVMHPWILGAMNNFDSIYYSLFYPSMLEGTPAIRHAPSIISELRDLKMLMQTITNIMKRHSKLTYELIENIFFEYFHHEEDKFKEIVDSKFLTAGDPSLVKCTQRFKGKIFPHQGPFFRGCMRVSRKSFTH